MTNKEYAADWEALKATDPEVAEALVNELERERTNLRLIASENYASPAVLAALGSTMTDKYAEGYPGRRYYGGCEFVDVTERLAIDRAKALFGADHANVQPHSGASANLAVFGAFLEPHSDDKVLGMVLAHGGHLTHGSPVNVSGKWFNFVGYEVDRETEQLDMDRIRDLAKAERPKIILAGYTAYPRTIDFAAFREIADEVGALLWVDASHFIGLVAGDAYPSPVPYADVVTFTTHKALRGPRGAMIVCKEEHAKAIDKAVFPMMQGGPLEHCIAAKAVALKEACTPEFKAYADRTVRDARALAAGLADEGLRIVSGGTDSHLILADTRPLDIDGKTAEAVADEVGIALNKNQIPYDPNPPSTPSGIRVGTPGPRRSAWTSPRCARSRASSATSLKRPEDAGVKEKARAQRARPDAAVPALPVAGRRPAVRGPVAARRPGPHTEPSVSAYLLIFLASAGTTFLVTPLVRRIGGAHGGHRSARGPEGPSRGDADDGWARDVCGLPGRSRRLVPAAVLLRHARRAARSRSPRSSRARMMVGLGLIDDRRGTSALAKFTAQIFIAGVLYLIGCVADLFLAPRSLQVVSLTSDLAVLLTILWVVVIVNAVNLVDGLDGLAAGMVAIAAGMFFIYMVRTPSPFGDASAAALLSVHHRRDLRGLPPVELLPGEDLHGGLRLDAAGHAAWRSSTISGVGPQPGPAVGRGSGGHRDPAPGARCWCCASRSSTWCSRSRVAPGRAAGSGRPTRSTSTTA